MIDFLIVGHGLAGATLAHLLLERGQRIMVLDKKLPHCASQVAAGLVNPLIGPKFNIPKHMEDCLKQSMDFFGSIGEESGQTIYRELVLHRIFGSEKQRDLWVGKTKMPAFGQFAQSIKTSKDCEKLGFEAPLGAGVQLANRLDFPLFLKLSEDKLRESGCWLDGAFEETDWTEARKIVFCEGYRVLENPWFGYLPFAPAQGEILLIKDGPSVAASNGTWVLPENQNKCLAGATWKHEDIESGPTESGKNKILKDLPLRLNGEPEIIEHRSGIRPSTRDRAPILGIHRENERMLLFNGFGSRGASTVPFYAKHMLNLMIDGVSLPEEADLKRFK